MFIETAAIEHCMRYFATYDYSKDVSLAISKKENFASCTCVFINTHFIAYLV